MTNALATSALGAVALSLLVGSSLLMIGRRRPALRHRVVVLGAASTLILPLVTLLLPPWLRWEMPAVLGTWTGSLLPSEVSRRNGPREAPGGGSPLLETPGVPGSAGDPNVPAEPLEATPPAEQLTTRSDRRSLKATWLLILELAGLTLVLSRRITAAAALRRLLRGAEPGPPWLQREVDQAKTRLALSREIPQFSSERVAVPMTFGILRPLLLLPASVARWPRTQRRAMLLHELAHVRRGDHAAAWIIELGLAVSWWNPLAWWLRRLSRRDAELSADGLVIESGLAPGHYARELIACVRSLRGSLPAVPAQTLQGGIGLRERLELLLDHPPGGLIAPRARLGLLASAIVGTVLLAAMTPVRAVRGQQDEPVSSRLSGAALPADVVGGVVAALADPDPGVRRSAVDAARHLAAATEANPFAGALQPLLADPDPGVRRGARVALGLAPAEPNLAWKDTARPHRSPRAGEIDNLRQRWKSPQPEVRERALRALRGIDHPAAIELAMTSLSRDSDSHVRDAAAHVLGDRGDSSVVPALVASLQDPSRHVRQAAAGALGDLGEPDGVPGLIRALSDRSEHVRQVAAGSLGRIGSSAGMRALLVAARDPSAPVRQAACDALGDVGDRQATPALVRALDDPSALVCRSALNSLVEVYAGLEEEERR